MPLFPSTPPSIPPVRKLETLTSSYDPSYFYHFSDEEKRALALALECKATEPFNKQNIQGFLNFATDQGRVVFNIIEEMAAKLRDRINPLGFILLRNLPVDILNGMTKQSSLSELQLLCAAQLFGIPFNYTNRRSGALIDKIMPVRENAQLQLGSNSVELFWHTEDAHLPCSPDYVALFCLRGDPDAQTLISCVIEDELDDEVSTGLTKPDFIIFPDHSIVNGQHPLPGPIIDRSGGSPRFRFDPLFTKCTNNQAQAVLEKIIGHLNKNAVGIELRAGDMLIIDNRRCVHARTAFAPRYQGNDRWLQRLLFLEKNIGNYVVDDKEPYLIKT